MEEDGLGVMNRAAKGNENLCGLDRSRFPGNSRELLSENGRSMESVSAIPHPLQGGADSEIDMVAGSVIGVMTATTLRYAGGDLQFVAFRIFHDRSAV